MDVKYPVSTTDITQHPEHSHASPHALRIQHHQLPTLYLAYVTSLATHIGQ